MKLEPQLHIERRVLAEVLVNPAALALAGELETSDFFHPHHRVAFDAMRNLHADGGDVTPLAVHEAIVLNDIAYEKHLGDTLDALWFATLIATSAGQYGELLDVVFPADLRQMRRIAKELEAL